jgi:hypothetical protein
MHSKERVMEWKGLGYTLSQPDASLRTKLFCRGCNGNRLYPAAWSEDDLR